MPTSWLNWRNQRNQSSSQQTTQVASPCGLAGCTVLSPLLHRPKPSIIRPLPWPNQTVNNGDHDDLRAVPARSLSLCACQQFEQSSSQRWQLTFSAHNNLSARIVLPICSGSNNNRSTSLPESAGQPFPARIGGAMGVAIWWHRLIASSGSLCGQASVFALVWSVLIAPEVTI